MIIRIVLALMLCLYTGVVWGVACDAVFTNGVQSHALGGSITFGGNTVVNGGGQTLHTTDLNMESWSQAICGGSVCNSSGTPAAASSPTFVTGNTANGAINVPATITQSRAAGNYNTVTVGQDATLTFTGTNYRTRATTTNFRSRIQFSPGTYWINGNLTLGQETILQRIGAAGTVRIFVNGNVSMGFRVVTQNFTHGQLLIYATGSITTQNEANLTAQVYAGGTVTFGFASVLHGSVSGSSVNIAQSMTVNYNSDALSTGDFAPFCDGISAPVLLGSWRMDEPYWNGLANEVIDSSGNNNHGRARIAAGSTPTASTALVTPAFTNGNQSTCSYGQFDSTSAPIRTNTYLELSGFPALPSSFTFTAWIRSTNAGAQHQRILVRDDADNGWGLSLADGTGEPRLRFFNRNIQNTGTVTGQGRNGNCGVFCLDTNTVIVTNAWHYVAATIDTTARTVTLYVYSASGSLLARTTGSFSGNWVDGTGTAAIGGETLASSEGRQSSFHFLGNIDEVEIYIGALTQDDIVSLRTRVRTCPLISPHHYELQVPANSIACMATPVTVVACADSSSPCTNSFLAAGGTTANLAVSGGSLANTTLAFNAGGVATTYLTHPLAADGTPVMVTLGGEQLAGLNPRQCCQGSSCSLNACTTTFNSAGLVFGVPGPDPDTDILPIPDQVAGTTDNTTILRAVKTNTTTGACEARVTGTRTVQLGYECLNPTSCVSGQTLTLNNLGARANSNNANPILYNNALLTFNASGSAPILLNYSDVGRVRLHARLNIAEAVPEPEITLVGTSNEFVVKPDSLVVNGIEANTAEVCAEGFIAAGERFEVTAEAWNANGDITPNFGKEIESAWTQVTLDYELDLGSDPGIFDPGNFDDNGINSSVRWSEVGSIRLRPELSDYLGAGSVEGVSDDANDDTAGPFCPYYFSLESSSVEDSCTGFTYMSHPAMTVRYKLEAYNAGGFPNPSDPPSITRNYDSSFFSNTANVGHVAENNNAGIDDALSDRVSVADFAWEGGVLNVDDVNAEFFRLASADGPFNNLQLGIKFSDPNGRALEDLDMDCTGNCKKIGEPRVIRFGRLRLDDAFGPESVDLPVNFATEYLAGDFWAFSNDSCTQIPLEKIAFDDITSTIDVSANRTVSWSGGSTQGIFQHLQNDPGADSVQFAGGSGHLHFTAPGAPRPSNSQTFPVFVNLDEIPWLRFDWNQDGDHNNDTELPPANIGFGQYRGHDRIIYWREVFE